jgi:DNA-binding transcriptional LysR family regulator
MDGLPIEPNDLLLFARVADEGSFTRAAAQLGLPKSSLSRRVAALEARLGERLLLRTTRKLALTDLGRALLEHGHQVAAEVDSALALSQHRQARPSGRLRVSMPSDLAGEVLEPMIASFIERYPAITLELDLTPRRVDLIGENFDLALRMGELADDASLAARRIAQFSMGLYAAPAYLKRRVAPRTPDELAAHDGLLVLGANGEPQPWRLARDRHAWQGLPGARLLCNAPGLVVRLAVSGVGLAMITDHFAHEHLRAGRLVQVLPDWSLPTVGMWAVFPGRRLMPARTRAFIDALVERLSPDDCRAVEERIADDKRDAAARLAPG